MTLTQEEAHRLFEYKDGVLYWKIRHLSDFKTIGRCVQWNERYGHKKVGSSVGKYVNVSINKIRYQVHRIIFLMHHGYFPIIVDHINGKTQDNKIENLRAATFSENLRNAKSSKNNTSGYKNVVWHKQRCKWNVRLTINRKNTSFGLYDDIELANLVAHEARNKYFGSFARHL
jgi:hypothetical protein